MGNAEFDEQSSAGQQAWKKQLRKEEKWLRWKDLCCGAAV